MRNTYNISLLRRRIQEALPRPLSPAGESALEGFLSLAGVSLWRPQRLGVRELSYVFDLGLPFALVGDNPSVKPYQMEAGDAVRDGVYPDARRWRVVHAGALLTHWGAAVQFAADRSGSPPQLEVRLPSGGTLDVEVVHADPAPRIDPGRDAPLAESAPRSRLLMIDVRGTGGRLEETAAALADALPRAGRVSGVLCFEPRFWISIEQKEWLHLALLNPRADVDIPAEMLGKAGTGRHALRVPLLRDAGL